MCICCVLTLVENAAQNFEVKRPFLDKVIHELTLIGIYISCISSLVENGAQKFIMQPQVLAPKLLRPVELL